MQITDSRLPQDTEATQFLVCYAQNDWLGFFGLSSALKKFYPAGLSETEKQAIVVRLAGELWDRNVRPGEPTNTNPITFVPWDMPKQAAVHRFQSELAALGHIPLLDTGEVCWFDLIET